MHTNLTTLSVLQDLEKEFARDAEPTLDLAARIVYAARFVVESAESLRTVKETADTLRRARVYFEQKRALLSAVNALAAEHVRLQHRIGTALAEIPRAPGTSSRDGTRLQQALAEMQMPRSSAGRCQTLARIDPQDLELYFDELMQREEEITTAGVLNYFTSKVVIDPREDTDTEVPEPPEVDEEIPAPRVVVIVCRHCGAKDAYEI